MNSIIVSTVLGFRVNVLAQKNTNNLFGMAVYACALLCCVILLSSLWALEAMDIFTLDAPVRTCVHADVIMFMSNVLSKGSARHIASIDNVYAAIRLERRAFHQG